jgi:Domain of unknown function (DUF4440)
VSANAISLGLPVPSRRAFVVVTAALSVAGLPIAAGSQPTRGADRGLATRSVAHYLDLERGLLDDLARRDRAAIQRRLADDFTSRTPDSDGVRSADEWLQQEFASPPGRLVRDLSVREADDLAIVSFLLDRTSAGSRVASTWFVVDVWRRSTDSLLARSISRPIGVPPKPQRPTGKE